MKKLIAMLITVAMVLTMSVPAFAADVTEDNEAAAPIAPAPAELTAAQVKAIKPAAKAASYSYTKIKVSWTAIGDIDGYKIYRATKKTGKYSLVKTVSDPAATSYINTGRTTGKTYWYKVRGYKKIDGKTVYTKYSDVKSAYARPNRVKINKVYLPKDEQVKVTWNKVSGATGYQVYRKRTDKSTWKLFKTVSGKATSIIDPLRQKVYAKGNSGAFHYDYADLKYNWEYKVRAYRTVNGKKVYGLFSTAKKYKPEWTIEEICEDLWKYGESLEWPLYEYAMPDGSENEDGEYVVPKKDGSTYHLKHLIGQYTFDGGYDWYGLYSNPANGETKVPAGATYQPCTEKNSSWGVLWPVSAHPYRKKNSILKDVKGKMKADLDGITLSSPVYWANASFEGVTGPNDEDEYWAGAEDFCIYPKPYLNGWKIYMLY